MLELLSCLCILDISKKHLSLGNAIAKFRSSTEVTRQTWPWPGSGEEEERGRGREREAEERERERERGREREGERERERGREREGEREGGREGQREGGRETLQNDLGINQTFEELMTSALVSDSNVAMQSRCARV